MGEGIDVLWLATWQVPEGSSAAAIPKAQQGPEVQPTLDTVARLLDKLQKKDTYHIFREPVTDEVVCYRPIIPPFSIRISTHREAQEEACRLKRYSISIGDHVPLDA